MSSDRRTDRQIFPKRCKDALKELRIFTEELEKNSHSDSPGRMEGTCNRRSVKAMGHTFPFLLNFSAGKSLDALERSEETQEEEEVSGRGRSSGVSGRILGGY